MFCENFIKQVESNIVNDLSGVCTSNKHNLAGLGCKITLTISNQKVKERSKWLNIKMV